MVITLGTLHAAEEYPLGPDSQRQAGVPQGTVTHYTWTSKVFPGTLRDYWVYVPAQYTPDKPACFMVFQDGESFLKEDGRARIPIVFDNLIAKHEMPVTIAILINPGVLKALSPGQKDRSNRSFEYDALGDRYARFLLDEILPEVAKHYKLSTDPDDRAISGLSSGGICSFTVAWTRPDAFRRVLSFIGSFTDLRGGDIYPALIRKTEPKPLRVFLQDGSKDLNIFAGDWWLANQSMASALEWAGYDAKFVTGDKDHDMEQGGAILPDALRWLWRDYPQPVAKPHAVHDGRFGPPILDPASDWELVSEDVAFNSGALTADSKGNVYFTGSNNIDMVGDDTTGMAFRKGTYAAGMALAPDGRLYACQTDDKRIVAFSSDLKETTIVSGVDCYDVVVTQVGDIYFTDPHAHTIWSVNHKGERREVYRDVVVSSGLRLSPDQSLLYVPDGVGKWVWSFRIQPDGSPLHGEPFYRLETFDESSATGAVEMTMDSLGFLYVQTNLGIQVCDEQGRVVLIINPPAYGLLPTYVLPGGIAYGGPDFQDLYVVVNGKLFKRHMLRKGFLPWVQQKPPAPQP
jgi:enterochelin esterase-like enzyme/sugar lactone lactonase YvrE